jgi:hypothetical protein
VALTASAFDHHPHPKHPPPTHPNLAKPYREEEIYEALEAHLGVRFHYAEALEGDEAGQEDGAALTPERVATMPPESRTALFEAAIQGDLEAAYEAIDRLRAQDAPLADELRALVRGYKFDELIELIE